MSILKDIYYKSVNKDPYFILKRRIGMNKRTDVTINGARCRVLKIALEECQTIDEWLNKNRHTSSFVVNDIVSLMLEDNNPLKICDISILDTTSDSVEETLNSVTKFVTEFLDEDCIIIRNASASTLEFPEWKYYMNDDDSVEATENRIKLPIRDIIKWESKLLERCGFVSINDYVKYEYRDAHIYTNKMGIKLRNKIDSILYKKEETK